MWLQEFLDRLISGDFTVEDRMTIDVGVVADNRVRTGSWAINELSLEKATHRAHSRCYLLQALPENQHAPY